MAKNRWRLRAFVAMPYEHLESARLRGLLAEVANELPDHEVNLIFAHEQLSTHALLIRNLRRLMAVSDFVLCLTDGKNPDVSFKAGLAVGLGKPLLLVILPGTWSMPETFVGHFYVELTGDLEDREELRSALAIVLVGLAGKGRTGAITSGRSIRLPRFSCAAARSDG